MTKKARETLVPEEGMAKRFELSGAKFEPDIAADLWPKIMKHTWLLSKKSRPGCGGPDGLHRFFRVHGESPR
ncbi:MAG: hypothetical protein ABFD81_02055 [Syntrophaceae bacterium]